MSAKSHIYITYVINKVGSMKIVEGEGRLLKEDDADRNRNGRDLLS